jgi:hypothetical protein
LGRGVGAGVGGGGGGGGVGSFGSLIKSSLPDVPAILALAPFGEVAEALVCFVIGCGISCLVQEANKRRRPAVMIMFFINQVLKRR